ncbi:polysaccharide biosynthesis tyrosine autokinase [Modestobacter sp. VKM Ac-2983]|uniref:polysaccharide biosynthesis tyrosine autokinase n=1 Tax=Modestobacter sp. VKM Ac-2983 TaxID=3004137 RepID=UPI0022AB7165|nr:polysaccharide biosynthesis tyrosine autokinase [Modestobacter sp. VKM Ac-2983]MCZ2804105.1 polysaccharide biosynthesis tyrosine autokinase [Modestobacter sp. VKM Ac-2983]
MGSRSLTEIVRAGWRVIAALTVVGVLAGLCWSLAAERTYRATASVFFSLQYGDSAADLVQGSTYTQDQVTSYARLATTPVVLQPVIDRLELATTAPALARQVEASAPVDTVIVEVTATGSSPAESARIADAVVGTLSDTVERLAPEGADGEPTVRATTVAPAEVPRSAATPNTPLDLATGLAVGFLAGLGWVWARNALDNRVRDAATLAELTEHPVIGTIGAYDGRTRRRVVMETEPRGPQAEGFRQLRTNLQFLDLPALTGGETGSGGRVLVVTSSLEAEGKSTVAANLAAALAETGARVLLVDADLRRPSVPEMLGLEGSAGLTTVLLGRAAPAEVVQDWGMSGLQVLTSGPLPPNPAELLGSPAMTGLLRVLRTDYDHVVLDTAPLLPVADGAILSRAADGAVLVVNATRARRPQVVESLQVLERVGATVLGLVLNQVDRDERVYEYREAADADLLVAPVPLHGTAAAPAPRSAEATLGGPTGAAAGGREPALVGTGGVRPPARGLAGARRRMSGRR